MRSLDLYSEKQIRDGSPDKIAASTAFVREANSLSLASLTRDTPSGSASGANEKKGLLSVFSDNSEAAGKTQQRDKAAMATVAFCNPLMLIGMGATFAIADELKRREEQAVADHGVVAERMQRVIARQAFLLKEKKEKEEKGEREGVERVNDTTVMSGLAASKKFKIPFVKDKVSIASGVARAERSVQPKQPRDYVKQNKLEKKKQMLLDYLEKFRGKLSLQEVSEVISQMEKLDKALLLMAS